MYLFRCKNCGQTVRWNKISDGPVNAVGNRSKFCDAIMGSNETHCYEPIEVSERLAAAAPAMLAELKAMEPILKKLESADGGKHLVRLQKVLAKAGDR